MCVLYNNDNKDCFSLKTVDRSEYFWEIKLLRRVVIVFKVINKRKKR